MFLDIFRFCKTFSLSWLTSIQEAVRLPSANSDSSIPDSILPGIGKSYHSHGRSASRTAAAKSLAKSVATVRSTAIASLRKNKLDENPLGRLQTSSTAVPVGRGADEIHIRMPCQESIRVKASPRVAGAQRIMRGRKR